MSFTLVVTAQPSDRDKAYAASAMIAIQGSIPYSRVLRCVEEAIAIAREEGYRAGWNDGVKNACAAVADSDALESY